MFIIAGLGNPGKQYENTRHNIGFQVVDALADKYNISVLDCKHKGMIGKGVINGNKVVLVKPLTFMNLSGECIREVKEYYKIDETEELIVISDDISLETGQIRMRKKGSAGGHNGLKNIIRHFGHEEFMRIKIGVGNKPYGYELADYVLGHFNKEENKILEETVKQTVLAVEAIMEDGIEKAMNLYNSKRGSKNEGTDSTAL